MLPLLYVIFTFKLSSLKDLSNIYYDNEEEKRMKQNMKLNIELT